MKPEIIKVPHLKPMITPPPLPESWPVLMWCERHGAMDIAQYDGLEWIPRCEYESYVIEELTLEEYEAKYGEWTGS